MQTVVGTGKTLDEAQAAALAELGVAADEVTFETLEEPRKLLGFSSGEFKVQATLGGAVAAAAGEEVPAGAPPVQPIIAASAGDATQTAIAQRAVEFVQETTNLMGLKTDVVIVDQEPGEISLEIRGQGLGILIGRQGQTLDALQMLAAVVANSGYDRGARVMLDAEHYRARQREQLVEMAQQQAEKAKETQQEVVIPDLKPFERRVIHLALKDDPEVETYSEGEGDDRCIVISPRNG